MDNLDKIKREISSMSKKERNDLANELEKKLSGKQQDALKNMLTSKSGKAELEQALNGIDLSKVKTKDDLVGLLDSAQIKKKIRDILG